MTEEAEVEVLQSAEQGRHLEPQPAPVERTLHSTVRTAVAGSLAIL